jgi:hypothetical protein
LDENSGIYLEPFPTNTSSTGGWTCSSINTTPTIQKLSDSQYVWRPINIIEGRRRGMSTAVVSDNSINVDRSVALNKGREYLGERSITYLTPR